ncbi:MAG TPA: 2Fe-2S iron-sulfur cluster-binding protein, partial [Trebonia sp.]|nr:2Fe-2S iron-sulfur cluster-binding protein [Trebonia sp.]
MADIAVVVTVNGRLRRATVEPRLTLADFLRECCQLTGTHLGCEHGVCGACTVLLDGQAVRGCLVFAVQADGGEVTTVEGIAARDGTLSTVQQAFR